MLKVKKTEVQVVDFNDIVEEVSDLIGMGFIEFRDRVAGFFDFSWGDSDGVLASFHQVREAIDAALDDHELDLPEEQAEQLNHQLNQYFDDIEHTGCSILVS